MKRKEVEPKNQHVGVLSYGIKIGPFQPVIHLLQNCNVEEKTNKVDSHIKCRKLFVSLVSVRNPALQHDSFVPCE